MSRLGAGLTAGGICLLRWEGHTHSLRQLRTGSLQPRLGFMFPLALPPTAFFLASLCCHFGWLAFPLLGAKRGYTMASPPAPFTT